MRCVNRETQHGLCLLSLSCLLVLSLSPLPASGHGNEFLFAKLSVFPGEMRLEITADCEGNPMIADRKHAAAVLPVSLQVQLGDIRKGLVECSDVRIEERTKFDESVPLPPGALDNSVPHQLLTALWRWKPDRESVRFTVPKDSKHDVLLWIVDPAKPHESPRWSMLLGGDASPPIVMPGREKSGWSDGRWWMAGGGIGLIVILLPVARIFLRRHRQ